MRIVPACILLLVALPVVGQSRIEQGTALFEQRKFKEAEALFAEVARTRPTDPTAAYWLGRVAMARDQVDPAASHFEKAVELSPNNSDYHLWLGRAYGAQAMRAGKLKQVSLARKLKAEFETAVRLDPGNLDARSGLINFYTMAPGFAGGGVDKAKAEAAEIAKRDPIRGSQELARIHMMKKEWTDAERILAEAINKSPSNMELRRDLGFLYQQREQWAKAHSTFAAIVAAHPDDMAAHYQIGRTAALSGTRLEEGEKSLLKYLGYAPRLDEPPLKWAHVRLGSIYEKQKRPDLARAQYQKALELGPAFKEAKEALAKAG